MDTQHDTIAAIATPPGRGGIGIIRISGTKALDIAKAITKKLPHPKQILFSSFYAKDQNKVDEGLVLFFPNPHSFTGEDVVELQGHGGPVVLDYLLSEVIKQGARLAKPGEFSERAFLNGKIDLVQAEAIADLISSGSRQAAQAALGSLQGVFSAKINELLTSLTQLRIYVEAAIDFPEEEIDFLSDPTISDNLNKVIEKVTTVLATATQGKLLQEGMSVVIIGKPNAGKSSLLNLLSGNDTAIVTDIPGTTRDVLREYIQIDGLPLHIIDTAGLRESENQVEQEGIKRAHQEIRKADHVLLVIDNSKYAEKIEKVNLDSFPTEIQAKPLTIIANKIDINSDTAELLKIDDYHVIKLSAKTGEGINLLKEHLKKQMGYDATLEGKFLARRRHLISLEKAKAALETGLVQLQNHRAGELLAEDLRQAQNAIAEITGEFTADDLLGEIFSSFCIGK